MKVSKLMAADPIHDPAAALESNNSSNGTGLRKTRSDIGIIAMRSVLFTALRLQRFCAHSPRVTPPGGSVYHLANATDTLGSNDERGNPVGCLPTMKTYKVGVLAFFIAAGDVARRLRW